MFELKTLEMGRRSADSSHFLHLTDPGAPVEIAYRFWLLRNAAGVILVDTGPSLVESVARGFPAMADPLDLLGKAGVVPADVDVVVLSHLHWDHVANLALFPRARVVVQEREVAFYLGDDRRFAQIERHFSPVDLRARLSGDGVQIVHGDIQLVPGLRLILVGGHTPGLQMVRVETPRGSALIASDAMPLGRNLESMIAPGILTSLPDALRALERARSERTDWVLPGHDPEPWLRFTT